MRTRQKSTSNKGGRFSDPVTVYAKKVVAGKIIAGPHVRDACARHLKDLKFGPRRGLYWDLPAALYAIEFFPAVLRLAGGQFEAMPFHLHASQQFKVGSIFGWKRKSGDPEFDRHGRAVNWMRRFNRVYIEAGKGNGKTPMIAGIGHLCLIADDEPRAEIYAAASMKEQAFIMFRDACSMWEQSPRLSGRLTATGKNPIINLADTSTGSFFRPISSTRKSMLNAGGVGKSGPRPHVALCDELHEHKDGAMVEMLERGFKFRRQPLLIMITNSGSDRLSVCWQEHQHAVRVAAGDLPYDQSDNAFSYVCALDEGDDPLSDPKCWIKANPLLGVTITKEYLKGVVSQAKAIPGKLNNILRLHFCLWTESDTAWLTREALEAVVIPPEFPEDGKRSLAAFTKPHLGKEIAVGLDLSEVIDFTAMAFIVHTGWTEVERTGQDGSTHTVKEPTFDGWIEAWTPGDTIAERSIRDSAHYDVWAQQGWVHAPPGPNIRLDFVAAHLADQSTVFRISKVAYDRYAYKRFEEELATFNFKGLLIEHPQGGKRRGAIPIELAQQAKRARQEMPQGLWMPGSVIELETLILEKRIRLLGNPALMTAFLAVAIERDPQTNYRWLSKKRSTRRIDPAIATAIAVGAATMATPKKPDINDFLRNAVVA